MVMPKWWMTNRALLIGSQTYGLRGCNGDVELMRGVLQTRGFDEIDIRTESDASRAGIVDGLESLISTVKAGDAVVFYYSGHGGRQARPDMDQRKAQGLSVYFQFIVPFDMPESEPGAFRGLLSEELTEYQRRMTDAFRQLGEVPNVTTILDCCHSGYMARGAEAMIKSVDFSEPKMFRTLGMRQHAEQLNLLVANTGLTTNPDAVRIVACQPDQSAFEAPSKRGGVQGALTDTLASVLSELGTTAVSWSVVGDLVRRRVRALHAEQRPGVEGPQERLIFSAQSLEQSRALPVMLRDGLVLIEAAQILGLSVGDEFDVVVPGAAAKVGTATVARIDGGSAVLNVSSPDTTLALASSALAVPTRTSLPKLSVYLDVDESTVATLSEQIRVGNRLSVGSDKLEAIVTISSDRQGLVLLDPFGLRWRSASFTDDVAGRTKLVQELEKIAKGHRLLDLASGEGPSALGPVVLASFGALDGNQQVERPLHGAKFVEGEQFFVSLRNVSAEPLYAWVFDVGVSGRTSFLLTERNGTMLGAAGTENEISENVCPGKKMSWPADVPRSATSDGAVQGRPETFVVVVADQQCDLSDLADSAATARGAAGSALDAVLNEARIGTREATDVVEGAPALRYRLDPIDFVLVPADAGPAA